MGAIDLDPASCAEANETIRALTYYDRQSDGLSREWRGRVWLNPPYGRGGQAAWTGKLLEEYAAGRVVEAVCLVTNATEAVWFQRLLSHTVCFPRGRISFILPGGKPARGNTHGSAIVYLGVNHWRFVDIFSRIGSVVRQCATR
jgi:ParB family chromosome partitioning protein